MVRECLGRFVGNGAWFSLFPDALVEHFVRFKSDHTPIFVHMKRPKKKRKTGMKSFKFETGWLLDDSCEAVVRDSWQHSSGGDISMRLKMMADHLKGWSGDKFNKLDEQIKEAEKALKEAQNACILEECIACVLCSRRN